MMSSNRRERFSSSADFVLSVGCFAASPFAFSFYSDCLYRGGPAYLLILLLVAVSAAIPIISIELSLGHISGLSSIATFGAISKPLKLIGWGQTVICSISVMIMSRICSKYATLMVASVSSLLTSDCLNSTEDCLSFAAVHKQSLLDHNRNTTPNTYQLYKEAEKLSTLYPEDEFQWPVAIGTTTIWAFLALGTLTGLRLAGKLFHLLLLGPILLLTAILIFTNTFDPLPTSDASTFLGRSLLLLLNPHSLTAADSLSFVLSIGFIQHLVTSDSTRTAFLYLFSGMGVYQTLASLHRHSETTNQPIRRRLPALIAPWIAFMAILVSGLLVGLVHLQSTLFISHVNRVDIDSNYFLWNGDIGDFFYSVPTAFSTLNNRSFLTFLFYLALLMITFGSLLAMFISVVQNVLDEIKALEKRKFVTVIVLALVHMLIAQITFEPQRKLLITFCRQSSLVIALFFFIAIALVYGWHEFERDTILALGLKRETHGLRQFFSPASQYHTAVLLLVGPIFVGMQFWDGNMSLFAVDFVPVLIPLLILWIALIGIMCTGLYDSVLILKKKPLLTSVLKRNFWSPLRYETSRGIHPPPMGNAYLCWCCCGYDIALIFLFVIECLSLLASVLSLLSSLLFLNGHNLGAPCFSLLRTLFTIWSLLGIYRAKTGKQSIFLLPFFLSHVLLLFCFPMAVPSFQRLIPAMPVYIVYMAVEGFLLAIAVGAHWQYRETEQRDTHSYQPMTTLCVQYDDN